MNSQSLSQHSELKSKNEAKEIELQKQLLLLKYKVQEQRLEKIWQQFTDGGFKPILIKGWAAALKYPEPSERLYVDVDLVFSSADFEKAKKFWSENKFDLLIDLHKEARHLDTLEFTKLYQNSVLRKCGQTEIRVLSEEDHLRVLCVHWLNDGGAFKEKLYDIYHAVNGRKEDFDWQKCLDVVDPKRRFWIITAIGIAHRYLNLNVDDLPFREELNQIPKWVYKCIEKEWKDEVKLLPIYNVRKDRKRLWQQIKKRFPPNTIQATIDLRGSFDNTPRVFYQIGDIFKRIKISWEMYFRNHFFGGEK